MAATIRLVKCTSTNAATETDLGASPGVALKSNDTAVNDPTTYPVTIPPAGSGYSYETWLRWRCNVAPDTQVTNFEYWGPTSTPKASTAIYVGTVASGSATTPIDSQSSDAVTRQDAVYHGIAVDDALAIAGTLTTIGHQTAYLVMQLRVASTAVQGDCTQTTHNFSYDEN